ncbi:unnamed protein product [Meloidogyne enterolobii]|uniref:Uncharacterized protein n=1 Tax=Meloidogyne enterolobii TaxID=390850 RepID=A0ACB0ZPL5_MELEN
MEKILKIIYRTMNGLFHYFYAHLKMKENLNGGNFQRKLSRRSLLSFENLF